MKNIVSKKGFLILLLVFTFSLMGIMFDRFASAAPCAYGIFDDCSYGCTEDSVQLVPVTSAGSWRECPYTHRSLGVSTSCGKYYQYTHMEGGGPVCDVFLCWSSYERMSADCT
ncbi:MAG TPA: hypothetical protein VMX13_10035 [Sedimentisphaerales bacterium]|nr:hypothetical protein [Sedimentisphaerales bacterium]